jgi:hypothetical protein
MRTVRVESMVAMKMVAEDDATSLKGAFIQIMPLTWDSFPLPVMDRPPRAHDLTGSTSGLRLGSLSKT